MVRACVHTYERVYIANRVQRHAYMQMSITEKMHV